MRLLLVTRDFPLHVGEVPVWSYELGRRFASRCNDFAWIAPRVATDAELDRNIPFEVIRLPCKPGALAAVLSLGLGALCRRRPFDALLAADWWSSAPGLLWRGRGGPGRVFVALPPRILNGSRGHDAASEPHARVRRRVLERLDGVFPIDGGCDTERFRPGTAPQLAGELGLCGRRVLLSRGRLTPGCGVDTILYALSALAGRYPDLRYVVVGDGPERSELEQLALRLHLAHRVQFLGQVADDRLPCLVQLCDIFVYAGRDPRTELEPARRVLLEASSSAKPLVATSGPGLPDVVRNEHTGLSSRQEACGDLLDNIVRLLDDRAHAQRLGENGRAHVLAHAGWDGQAERLLHAMSVRQPALPPGVLRHGEARAPLGEARIPAPQPAQQPASAAHRSNDAILN
jgi:phosphatidylinositol alpha-1,6-mannosyltransferase